MDIIKGAKIRRAKRFQKHYHLAKSLGFTALEAGALSNRSVKNIIKYATEQGKVIPTAIDVTTI